MFLNLACLAISGFGQTNPDTTTLIMQGSFLQVDSNTNLYIDGSLQNKTNPFQFDAFPDGDINNLDSIHIAGDFDNRINKPLFSTGSYVLFRYHFRQYIRNDTINFDWIYINKPNQILTLERGITVSKGILFRNSSIDLVDYNVDLLNFGVLQNETFENRVYGDKGYVIARNRLVNPSNTGDVGTLGLSFNPQFDNLGLTQIYRRNDEQDSSAEGSIARFYDVLPTNTSNSDVVFNYFDLELRQLPVAQQKKSLRLFYSPDFLVDEAKNWKKFGTQSISNGLNNTVEGFNMKFDNSGDRWSLADTNCVNPPKANLSATPVRFCKGDSITLFAGDEAKWMRWLPSGDTTRYITLDSADIPKSGKDTLTLILIGKNQCQNTETVIVETYDNPIADFSVQPSYCEGDQIVISNQSTIASGLTLNYTWKKPDGTTANNQNIVFTASYLQDSLELVALSPFGCIDSIKKTFWISPFPNASFSLSEDSICAGLPITLTNNSTIDTGAIALSKWYFGDGFSNLLSGTDALNNELKSYNSSGQKTVSLAVTSNAGCKDSITTSLTVIPSPNADFTFSGFLKNQPIAFQNQTSISGNIPLTYQWQFDTLGNSSAQDPTFTFQNVGDYAISLVSSNTLGCSDSITKTVSISGLPQAIANYHVTDSCEGGIFNFVNTSFVEGSDTLTYLWTFGDGDSSRLKNPNHAFSNAGTYTVKLWATTSTSNLTDQTQFTLKVYSFPQANFVVTENCFGDTTVFTNTSVGVNNTTYLWNISDTINDSTLTNFNHIYSASGLHNATLIATSSKGCADSVSQPVIVNPIPIAKFGKQNICEGNTVFFEDSSSITSGSITHYWDLAGSFSNLINPSKTYTSFGDYPVSLTVTSSAGCTDVLYDTITVFDNPEADFSFSNGCAGDSVSFNNLSTIQNDSMLFVWNFANLDSSNQENPKYLFNASGNYTVNLLATSSKGCTNTKSKIVSVLSSPVAQFMADTTCFGDVTSFTNQSSISNQNQLFYLWNFGNGATSTLTNPTITYSNDTTYIVNLKVTASSGCETEFVDTVEVKPIPQPGFTTNGISCLNDSIQFIDTSKIKAGSLQSSWNFNDGVTSTELSPKHQFTFAKTHFVSLTSTSNFGCQNTITQSVLVYQKPNIQISLPDSVCIGIPINPINNTTSITSSIWKESDNVFTQNSPTITTTQIGNLLVKYIAENANGCIDSVNKTVFVKENPNTQFTYQLAPFGDTTVFTNLSQNASPTSYQWSFGNGNTATTFNATQVFAVAGIYTISLTATSSNGCLVSTQQNIQITGDEYAGFSVANVPCLDKAVQFTNTSAFYNANAVSYLWSFGDGTTSTIKNPIKVYDTTGTFEVTLTATPNFGNALTVKDTIGVFETPKATFTPTNICKGEPIQLWPDTIFPNSQTTWKLNGQAYLTDTLNLIQTNSGYQFVEMVTTNSNGCKDSLTQMFQVYDTPSLFLDDTIYSCLSSLSLSSQVAGTNYNWNSGVSITSNLIVNTNGLATLSLVDTNGCSLLDEVYVKLNTTLPLNLGEDSTYCSGLVLNAGSSADNFIWNDGDTNQTKTITTSGIYAVTISQSGACLTSDSISVVISGGNTISLGQDIFACSDSLITIGVSIPGVNYTWNTGDTISTITPTSNGSYTLTITDSLGCSNTDDIMVFKYPTPNLSVTQDQTVCLSDFPINILAVSNDELLWSTSDTSQTITATSAGSYWVTSTNNFGCVAKDTITLFGANSPLISLADTITICQDSLLILDAGNVGATYQWGTGDTTQTFNTSVDGLYSLIVTNQAGCQAQQTILVQTLSKPQVFLGNDIALCASNAPITLQSGFNTGLVWNTGDTTASISVDSSATYSVIVTDTNQCAGFDSINVIVHQNPVVNLGADTSFCSGNTITLNAQNQGANYLWQNGNTSNSISINKTGVYSVQVTDSNNCSGSDSKTVTVYSLPSINLGPDQSICQGNSLNLFAGNHAGYLWSTGDTVASISANLQGVYSVTVTNVNNCSKSDNITLTVNSKPTVNLGPDQTVCGSAILNSGLNNLSFQWSNSDTSSFTKVFSSGIYILKATNTFGCFDEDTINVTVKQFPVFGLGNDTAICANESITIGKLVTGATYLWNTGATSPTIKPTTSGLYSVHLIGSNQCAVKDTLGITINPFPNFSLGGNKNLCEGSAAQLNSGMGQLTHIWNTQATSNNITVDSNGVYWVKVTNQYNCSNTDTVEVSFQSLPFIGLPNDTVICDKLTLELNDSLSYSWNDGTTQSSKKIVASGNYRVTATSNLGCKKSDTIQVSILPIPQISLPSNLSLCGNASITLNPGGNAANYLWNNGVNQKELIVTDSGVYSIIATHLNGCKAFDTVTVNALSTPQINLASSYQICQNETLTVGANNQGAQYKWYKNDTLFSTADSVSISFDGNFKVEISNALNCAVTDSFFVEKTGNAIYADFLVQTDVFRGDTLKFINLSYPRPFTSFWSFGDGITTTEEDPNHIYLLNGNLSARLTVTNGVCTNALTKTITINQKNLPQIDSENILVEGEPQFILNAITYPNPSNGQFALDIELSTELEALVDVFDISGRRWAFTRLYGNSLYHQLYQFNDLPTGYYFVRISVENQIKVLPIIIVQ